MATIVPEPPDDSPDLLLRLAAELLNHLSPTGTYADPCGECGMTGAFLDAVADWLDATAASVTFANFPPAVAVARTVLEGGL